MYVCYMVPLYGYAPIVKEHYGLMLFSFMKKGQGQVMSKGGGGGAIIELTHLLVCVNFNLSYLVM